MSVRKKRSLSNVTVGEPEIDGSYEEVKVRPAVSNFISKKDNGVGQAVRGTEFLVNPENCKPWVYHNRDEVWLNADRCSDLISSIRKNGQQIPVLARKLENDPDGKSWEIIAGRRRWYACGYLKIKLRLKAISSDDRQCAIIMNLENKDRADISEFEDAISYRQQLKACLFDSQDEMASALDMKKSKLSKMLTTARLCQYKTIMSLIPDITQLKINPAYNLFVLLQKTTKNKEVILARAEQLVKNVKKTGKTYKTNVVINELTRSLENSNKTALINSKQYCHNNLVVLDVARDSKGKVTLTFNEEVSESFELDAIKKVTIKALEEFIVKPVS